MIARLDTAASGNTDGASYSVSAGSDRCLVIGIQQEGNLTADQISVTWGGQSMTQGIGEFQEAGGNDCEVRLFYLLEAGIAAASGSTISITGEATNFDWSAISYTGVNQTGGSTTVPETNTDLTGTTTPNPLTGSDIVSVDENAVVALAGCGNATTASWGGTNPLTEQTDQQDSGSATTTGSLADRLVSASETVDVECTWASQNRAVVCAMELAAAPAGETANGDGPVPAIEASGNAQIIKDANGTPSIAAVEASGNATVHRAANGAATITAILAAGAATIINVASDGAPSLAPVEAAGTALIRKTANGTPGIAAIEASGAADVTGAISASGDGPVPAVMASGTAAVRKVASGAASIAPIEASGTAIIGNIASGSSSIAAVVANGTATIVRVANGSPSIASITANGNAVIGGAIIVDEVDLIGRELAIEIEARHYGDLRMTARIIRL